MGQIFECGDGFLGGRLSKRFRRDVAGQQFDGRKDQHAHDQQRQDPHAEPGQYDLENGRQGLDPIVYSYFIMYTIIEVYSLLYTRSSDSWVGLLVRLAEETKGQRQ